MDTRSLDRLIKNLEELDTALSRIQKKLEKSNNGNKKHKDGSTDGEKPTAVR